MTQSFFSNTANRFAALIVQIGFGVVVGSHRPHMEEATLRAIAFQEHFPLLNDLEAQQRPSTVERNHIDCALQHLFEQAPHRQSPLKDLLGVQFIVEEYGHINIAETMRLTLCYGAKEINGYQAILVAECVLNLGANRFAVHGCGYGDRFRYRTHTGNAARDGGIPG